MAKMESSLPDKIFTLCTTQHCPLAVLCERKHRQPVEDQSYSAFSASSEGARIHDECDWYIPRKALTEEKGSVFRQQGRKGMKSNRHVMPHQRKRVTPEELGLTRPDLMVSRHIKMGIDVNKDKEGK